MTPAQLAHMHAIAERAKLEILKKYSAGQKEHGGELWLKSNLIDRAIEEAIDQVIYLFTLKEQLDLLRSF